MSNSNTVTKPTHDDTGALVPNTPQHDLREDKQDRTKQNELPEDLTNFLLELFQKCRKKNETDWLRIKQQMVRARKYFDGQQNGVVNDSLEWREYDLRPNEIYYIDNVFHPHVQTALMELSRGRTELTFKYNGVESRRGKIISDLAKALYRDQRRKLFTVMKKQQEDLSLLLNGLGARYTFFDKSKGRAEKIPAVNAEKYEKEGVTVCGQCKAPAKEKKCPNCGSTKKTSLKVVGTKHGVHYEEVREGKVSWVSVDPLGLTFDIHATTIEDSSFLIWDLSIDKAVLESENPDIVIKSGLDQQHLRYQHEQEQATPHAESEWITDRQSDTDTVAELNQGWFDPALYKDKEVKQTVTLRNGTVLDAGEKLGKYFPNGIYLSKNGKKILDMWPESKNDKWDICPYVTRLGTMVGGGTSVALANQDTKNDLRNFQMTSAFHDAFRREFVDPKYIDPDNIPNDPTERAVLKKGVTDNKKIVGGVIDVLPGGQLSQEVYTIEDKIDQSAQNQLGTFSASGAGMPDLKAVQETATGFQAYREISVGRFQPMLQLRADMLDKEQAYKILELCKQHYSPRQWKKIAGDYGQDAIEAFLNCDIREDVIIEVAFESYMPRTTSQEIRKGAEYLEIMGVMAQFGIQPDSEYAEHMADLYGIPQHIRTFNVEYNKARQVISMMEEYAAAIVAEVGDAPTIDFKSDPQVEQIAMIIIQATGVEIDTEMDNHEAMIESYRDWWVTDAAKNAPKLLLAAVSLQVHLHELAQIEGAIDDQTKMEAIQGPAMQKQAAQEAEAQNREEQGAVMQGLAEMSEADAQREHEASESEKQRTHEMEQGNRGRGAGVGLGESNASNANQEVS